MGERSLISVVVPAWRAEKTLASTLDSILLQTLVFSVAKESPFLPLGKYTADMLLYRSRQYLYA